MNRSVATCVLATLLLVATTGHVAHADVTGRVAAATGGIVVPMPKVGVSVTLPASWTIEHYEGPSKAVTAAMRADLARVPRSIKVPGQADLKGFQLYAVDYKSQTRFANSIGISDFGRDYPVTLNEWQQYAEHTDGFGGSTTTSRTFRFDGATAYDAATTVTLPQTEPPVVAETHRIYVRSGTHNVLIVFNVAGNASSRGSVAKRLIGSLAPVR